MSWVTGYPSYQSDVPGHPGISQYILEYPGGSAMGLAPYPGMSSLLLYNRGTIPRSSCSWGFGVEGGYPSCSSSTTPSDCEGAPSEACTGTARGCVGGPGAAGCALSRSARRSAASTQNRRAPDRCVLAANLSAPLRWRNRCAAVAARRVLRSPEGGCSAAPESAQPGW